MHYLSIYLSIYLSMDKVRLGGGVGAAVLFLCVLLCLYTSIGYGDDGEQKKKTTLWEWEKLRSAYSVYSALFPATSIGNYWDMVKAFLNHAYALSFPPNIERGDEAEAVTENGAAGEKVKEALAKSIGKSKSTLEDAAKSAADIARETANRAKDKVKRSLSEDREKERQNEL